MTRRQYSLHDPLSEERSSYEQFVRLGGQKRMAMPQLRVVTPSIANRTVTPRRIANRDLRTREYLTADEVDRLMTAVKGNRWGHRDATMVLVGYRHGLRAAELVD